MRVFVPVDATIKCCGSAGGCIPNDDIRLVPDGAANPPTKSLDFRGFDSSKLLILKGGNSHVH